MGGYTYANDSGQGSTCVKSWSSSLSNASEATPIHKLIINIFCCHLHKLNIYGKVTSCDCAIVKKRK